MKRMSMLFLYCLPLFLQAQEGLHASGGDGSGSGGSFSFSFGQFAFENFFAGSSSIEQGVQHPWENDVVPPLYALFDSTLQDGDLLCYNARVNLSVAGDEGPVLVPLGARSNFIAAGSISFLHGFHAQHGSYVHGSITTDGTFCDGMIVSVLPMLPPVAKSVLAPEQKTFGADLAPGLDVKLYPNPNPGRFTLSLSHSENEVGVTVYNLAGARVYQSGQLREKQIEIDLPYAQNGVYFVKVDGGNAHFVKKMIVGD